VLERARGHVEEDDGRQFERHPYPSLVRVTPLEAPGGRLRPYLTRQCPTIDLSQSGIRLLWIGGEKPQRVVITFVQGDGALREIESAVVWWKELGPSRIELGLRFVGAHPCAEPLAAANDEGETRRCSTG
jgi:hypothetical protein